MIATGEPRLIWAAGAELGEGPLWDDDAGRIYWIDIEGRRLHGGDATGAHRRSWTLPTRIGFAVLSDRPGLLLLGLESGLVLLRPDAAPEDAAQALRPLLRPAEMGQDTRPNDGKVDAAGRLWFGSMALSQREGGGALHCLAPDGRCRCVARDWTIPNGPAISADGHSLYWADSHRRRIFAFAVDGRGRLMEQREALTLQGGQTGVPDGMALDTEGCLWVAMNGGGCVRRFGPDGAEIGRVALPTPAVSACAFGGADMRTLFVTTARQGAGHARGAAASGALFAVWTEVSGVRANRFPLQGLHLGGQEGST